MKQLVLDSLAQPNTVNRSGVYATDLDGDRRPPRKQHPRSGPAQKIPPGFTPLTGSDFLAPQAVQLSNQLEEDLARLYGLRAFFKWREEVPDFPKSLGTNNLTPLVVLNPN
ncbi:MAG: hypothetical protein ACI959_000662 [Limisphaerales bacterium]|jgi:hypothetical protein